MKCDYCMADPCVCVALADPAPPTPAPTQSTLAIAVALARGDVTTDGGDGTTSIRGAWRDVKCSGNGSESYRRRLAPGAQAWGWVSGRLPPNGMRADARHCEERGLVSVGDLVAEYSRSLGRTVGKVSIDKVFVVIDLSSKPLKSIEFRVRRDGQLTLLPDEPGPAWVVPSPKWGGAS